MSSRGLVLESWLIIIIGRLIVAVPAPFVISHHRQPIPAVPQLTRRQTMFNLCRRPLTHPRMELKDAKPRPASFQTTSEHNRSHDGAGAS